MIKKLLLASSVLLASCASQAPTAAVAPSAPPKLVVFVVIDGLPMRQVTQLRDRFGPDGFKRFLDRGAWYANAHYGYAYTVTAAGHATMLTGAYSQRSGIIGNEWLDPQTGAKVYNTGDPAYQYLGEAKTDPLAGTSPRNLKAETVGDTLRRQHPAAKVIAISGKDRGAILPAGHSGTAYMYMTGSGRFASSSYYMQEHPAWVSAFNAVKPAEAFAGKTWTPLLPEAAYKDAVPDSQPWQNDPGNGTALPQTLPTEVTPRLYGKLLGTPFGDEITLAFARAAIEGEQLGADGVPDILSVSLSSHDYVNHAMGPESRLSMDHLLNLDRHLQAFFAHLDARVGAGNYVAVLTADHGFQDTPEWARTQGRASGRQSPRDLLRAIDAALDARFGKAAWTRGFSGLGVSFDPEVIASHAAAPAEVHRVAQAAARLQPGIADAFTREELLGTDSSRPLVAQIRQSFDPERSAPLQLVMRPNWLLSTGTKGTSHGSPHPYDTHVPILAWGPAWFGQGEVQQRVEVVDLAPTLAGILRVPVPSRSQGQVLPKP